MEIRRTTRRRELGAVSFSRRTWLQGAATAALAAGIGDVAAAASPGGNAAPQSPRRWPVRPLLRADLTRSLGAKALAKPVHATHIIDDMESDGRWIASDVVKLSYTTERARAGTRSLRVRVAQRNDDQIRASRTPNGSFNGQAVLFDGMPFAASVHLPFATPQDWTAHNRLSLWCYLHPTEIPVTSLSLQFTCEGASAGPADPVAVHYIGDLTPGAWNLLTWEISEYQRDRVSNFVIFFPVAGDPVRGVDTVLGFDFDQLALERVDVEQVDGWQIMPGKLAYSHIGYPRAGAKIAYAAAGPDRFALVDAHSGRTAADLPATVEITLRGRYARLDFSAFATPGHFRLRYGEAQSEPFAIGDGAWRTLIDSQLNALYGFRCGFAVPGVHDCCHLDTFAEYKGERRTLAGGWHDAANLTQHSSNTHLTIYALLELYSRLVATRGEPALADRVLEEALWGLEWSRRTRFGPGVRCTVATASYWTDSVVGGIDDVVQTNVVASRYDTIVAVLATASAAHSLKGREPVLAAQLLADAREDYRVVADGFAPQPAAEPFSIGTWRDELGYFTRAAIEMHRATGEAHYAEDAVRYGRMLLGLQEQRFIDGIPVAGYFYADAKRSQIAHEIFFGLEDSGLIALEGLCEALPDHPDWIDWYAGLALYADHFCATGARASAPFNVLPSGVWRTADLDRPEPPDRQGQGLARVANPIFPTPPTEAVVERQRRRMFEEATELGPHHRLRVFTLWADHIRHGYSHVQLTKSAGLAAAARVRRRADLAELAADQLRWHVGQNPFSRSLVFGVGHDYWQTFSVSLPNFVGGLPVGMNSYRDDSPAWPNNAVFPYKEQWEFSNCRMIQNLAVVGMPAMVRGTAPRGVAFRHLATGHVTALRPGTFDIALPAGAYEIRFGDAKRRMTLADAAHYDLPADDSAWVDIVLAIKGSRGRPVVEATLVGAGAHRIALRVANATVAPGATSVMLVPGETQVVRWPVTVKDDDGLWLLLAIPDGILSMAAEASGVARKLNLLGAA